MAGAPIERGAVLIGAHGRIQSIGPDHVVPRPPGVAASEFPDAALLPGLINTHTHLELTGFDGLVTEAGSSPITRTGVAAGNEAIKFEVKIQVLNPPESVRPGFSCAADIITGFRPKTLSIPIQALVVREKEGTKAEEEGVYTFDAKTQQVKFAPVKTGITGETQIEIASGVGDGTQIVTGPFRALREIKEGQKVKIAKEKKEDKEKGKEQKS